MRFSEEKRREWIANVIVAKIKNAEFTLFKTNILRMSDLKNGIYKIREDYNRTVGKKIDRFRPK